MTFDQHNSCFLLAKIYLYFDKVIIRSEALKCHRQRVTCNYLQCGLKYLPRCETYALLETNM